METSELYPIATFRENISGVSRALSVSESGYLDRGANGKREAFLVDPEPYIWVIETAFEARCYENVTSLLIPTNVV